MQAKYEVIANSSISKELPEETQKQLEKVRVCVQMIESKNGIDKVKGKLDVNTNEVTLVLFNGDNGPDTDKVDNENKKIIELLKTFDAKISKSNHHRLSYWSNSEITIPYQKIENVLEALTLLDDVPLVSREIAKC